MRSEAVETKLDRTLLPCEERRIGAETGAINRKANNQKHFELTCVVSKLRLLTWASCSELSASNLLGEGVLEMWNIES